jgi:hypothetical protein
MSAAARREVMVGLAFVSREALSVRRVGEPMGVESLRHG